MWLKFPFEFEILMESVLLTANEWKHTRNRERNRISNDFSKPIWCTRSVPCNFENIFAFNWIHFPFKPNQTKRRFIAFYNITCWIVCLNFIWNWTFFPFFFRTNYMWHGFLFNLVNYTENKKHYVRSSQIFKQNEIGDFSTKKVDP